MHGFGTYRWISQGRQFTGEYNRGVYGGYGECTYESGNVYRGQWKNGKFNGEGTLLCPDGK